MENKSIKVFEVGGAIRDSFLGLPNKDRDFVVLAESFDSMKKWVLEQGGEIFLEHEKFFTLRCKVPSIGAADFVLARKDGEYRDGRHPESVEIADNIEQELARRDFSCNAMAKDIETGEFIDPFNGKEDIKNRLIRCVGNAEDRFNEDSLRMLRALRFAITKQFSLDSEIQSCLNNLQMTAKLSNISAERVREELFKMFHHDTVESLYLLNNFPVLRDLVLTNFGIWLKPTTEQ